MGATAIKRPFGVGVQVKEFIAFNIEKEAFAADTGAFAGMTGVASVYPAIFGPYGKFGFGVNLCHFLFSVRFYMFGGEMDLVEFNETHRFIYRRYFLGCK